jgi:hypothetical protein
MNDYMLAMVRIRAEEMRREAGEARLAAEVRRAARDAPPVAWPPRGPVTRLAHWLTAAAAKMRPTATGR